MIQPTMVMLDLETLGTRPGSAVMSVGACEFNHLGPTDVTFHAIIRLDTCMRAGLVVDRDTEAWWLSQPSPAKRTYLDATGPSMAAQSLAHVLTAFRHWIGPLMAAKESTIWARGAAFDFPLLAEAYYRCGHNHIPWNFRQERCARTITELAPTVVEPARDGITHNAADDAIHQARHVARVLSHLRVADAIVRHNTPEPANSGD